MIIGIKNRYKYLIFLTINKANSIIKHQGRLLIRKSGTEPMIRIMGESTNKALLIKCIKIIKKSIK